MSKNKPKSSYSESDIDVLKGLEPVQKRPGMYTRTDSPNHIIQEVIDNAQDEALAGHANEITVELHEDGSISVSDNGRGIPTGIHPVEKKPAVEVVFTHLHSGGKFRKGEGNTYSFTGGLHGVGVSVTNALSTRLEVVIKRDGNRYTIAFENGLMVEPLKRTKLPADQADQTGTSVRVYPDPKYFDQPGLNISEMEKYLRSKAVLLKGTVMSWLRPGRPPQIWSFPDGLKGYLEQQVGEEAQWIAPIFELSSYHKAGTAGYDAGEGFDLVFGWAYDGKTVRDSYVNLIPTGDGGRHETGMRAAILDAIRSVAERTGSLPKGIKIEPEDVLTSLSFVLSTKLMDPHFQNQTKDKMTSEKGHRLVLGLLRDPFELWLNENPLHARAIIDVLVASAIRRSKTGQKTERKKSVGASVLPGKLSDCETKDVQQAELFLVEGDSAGGSSKQGRNRTTQAILPLRGKLLNTWDLDRRTALASDTIHDIASAIGVDAHSATDKPDMSRLRYGKIFIMADADVDGQHIQVLLLTLFLKHFPALLKGGHIYIAQAPLFRIDAPAKKGTKTGPRKIYAIDEKELADVQKQLEKEGFSENQYSVARFKGLGEMNAAQLGETTMNPDGRRSLRVDLSDALLAEQAFDRMMAKKTVKQRKDWMEAEGGSVDVD